MKSLLEPINKFNKFIRYKIKIQLSSFFRCSLSHWGQVPFLEYLKKFLGKDREHIAMFISAHREIAHSFYSTMFSYKYAQYFLYGTK